MVSESVTKNLRQQIQPTDITEHGFNTTKKARRIAYSHRSPLIGYNTQVRLNESKGGGGDSTRLQEINC